jgi:hypothetical protein
VVIPFPTDVNAHIHLSTDNFLCLLQLDSGALRARVINESTMGLSSAVRQYGPLQNYSKGLVADTGPLRYKLEYTAILNVTVVWNISTCNFVETDRRFRNAVERRSISTRLPRFKVSQDRCFHTRNRVSLKCHLVCDVFP